MDFNAAYWVCVVDALGFGNHKVNDILRSYKNAKNFLADKVNLWKFSGFLSSKNIAKLKCVDLNKAQKILARCKTLGYDVITIENPSAATDKELIVFRDSFGSSLSPLLVEGYAKVTVVDIRYISPVLLGNFIEFHGQDVLFIYSSLVLNNSSTIK